MMEQTDTSVARLVQDAGLFGSVLEAIDEAVLLTNADLTAPGPEIVYANPAFSRLTGYGREALIGRSPRFLQGPETDRTVLNRLRAALQRGVSYWGEAVNYRADGKPYRVEWLIAPVYDGSGQLSHWTAIQRDVTDLRRMEIALQHAESRVQTGERRERQFVAELQNRVRNTLAVVRALARGTSQTAETAEDYAMHLDGRLGAFTRVQNALLRGPTASVDLYGLVADELLSVAVHDGGRARLSGPGVLLRSEAAETLMLAIHELTTNAIKFGALGGEQGRLTVNWWVEGEGGEQVPTLVFEWVEIGLEIGAAPQHRGFGLRTLERTLPGELDAEVTINFGQRGLTCRILVPLTDRICATA